MQQLTHDQIPLQKHLKQIIVVCNFIKSPANLGLISRNAEAFGVQQIILSPDNYDLVSSNRFLKTARSAHQNISYTVVDKLNEEILVYKKLGFDILALELTKTSIPLKEIKTKTKVVVVLGNENYGIPENLLALCNQAVHIVQFGQNSSINVAQALGVCLYELTR